MSRRNDGAAPGLPFLEPRFSPTVHAVARLLSPLYLRFGEGVSRVKVRGAPTLVDEYHRFRRGESRLIVAFRHPSASDAAVVGYLFGKRLPELARREGRPLPGPAFVHFLYGRGVPLWAGPPTGWLLPRLGAIPVYHQRADARGMRAVRAAIVAGRFPVALAPEGQVTYLNKQFGALETGTGRIAVWGDKDLRAADGTGAPKVRILPLSLEYRYGRGAGAAFDGALRWIEEQTGLTTEIGHRRPAKELQQGLLTLTEELLNMLDRIYANHRRPGRSGVGGGAPGSTAGNRETAAAGRVAAICDAVLRAGEAVHGLSGEGPLLKRLFRLRDAGWRWRFREDLARLSPAERSMADSLARQAKEAARHMEVADALEYLDPTYIAGDAPFERLLEYLLVLQDVVNRLSGGTIANRMRPSGRMAVVTVGAPRAIAELTGEGATREREAARRVNAYIASQFEALIR